MLHPFTSTASLFLPAPLPPSPPRLFCFALLVGRKDVFGSSPPLEGTVWFVSCLSSLSVLRTLHAPFPTCFSPLVLFSTFFRFSFLFFLFPFRSSSSSSMHRIRACFSRKKQRWTHASHSFSRERLRASFLAFFCLLIKEKGMKPLFKTTAKRELQKSGVHCNTRTVVLLVWGVRSVCSLFTSLFLSLCVCVYPLYAP